MENLNTFLKNKKIKYYDTISSKIEENFHHFANENCKAINPADINEILDSDSFEEEEGYTLDDLFLEDPSTTFYRGKYKGEYFFGIKSINTHYIFSNQDIDFSDIPEYENHYYDKMQWLLLDFQAVDTFEYMGEEINCEQIDNEIQKIEGEHATRYIFKINDKNVAGIQVKNNIIENIFTANDYREKGLAKMLINTAKEDFPELQHSNVKTELGEKMASKIKL